MKKVAIIGTVGLPAKYGGFETLVEQLVKHNKSEDLQYSVYCSKKSYDQELWVYHGAKTEYVNLNANGLQSIPYDIISLCKAAKKSDVVLILGVSGCAFLPIFRIFSKKKLIINIDGLEHRREKWNKWIRKFLKYSEALAVRYADIIISDNKAIADYVEQEYKRSSELIAYGGDHAFQKMSTEDSAYTLAKYGLKTNQYALAICRIEPENNVLMILDAFANLPSEKLVFIGNWTKSSFGMEMMEKYSKFNNINILPAIYDNRQLNVLRSNCSVYLHGHSAGGTNPSLVEAMFFSKPIFAYDCIYNRETTENKASYFTSSNNLISLLESLNSDVSYNGKDLEEIAKKRYTWEKIAAQYEKLY